MQIRRIYRSHNSCVVTLTKQTLRRLGAKRGDYLTIEDTNNGKSIVLTKVQTGDKIDVEAKVEQAAISEAISKR